MLRKPITCNNCSLEHLSQGFSICEGTANNGVMIVGESLGKNELNDSLPFRPYAEAGSVLQIVFKRLNLNRSDFLLANLIYCQPPYNVLEGASYEESSIVHCQVHFNQVFNKFKSKIKVILALGNLPMRYLCPEIQALYIQAKQDKDKSLLKKLSISSLRGYKFESKFPGIPIISSLHPSFIRRTGSVYSGVLLRDLYSALQIAKGYNEPFKINAITNPSSDDAINFYELCKANPQSPITYDIETPMTIIETDESEVEYKDIEVRDIDSVQFSLNENEGIFLDWIQFKDIIAKILALPNPKLSWNGWQFDQTHLEYHLGKGCIKGLNIDLIWYWHHVQPDFNKLGRGLQFATNWFAPNFPAWKHISDKEPRKYGILDVIATNKIGRGLDVEFSNKKLYPFTKSIQEGFIDDLVKLKPILDDISLRGLPIDVEARKIFAAKLDIEIAATMERLQEKYPFELRNVTPKLGYKYEPKEIQILSEKFNSIYRDPNNSKSYIIFTSGNSYSLALHKFIEENSRLVDNEKKKDNSGLILREFKIDGFVEKRWCHIEQFKPTSSPQVIEYIKFKKYKVPKKKDYEKGDKETSSKDEIYKLSEDHPEDTFLNDIVLIRELKKMRTTYVGEGKKGWKLGADNRIHTTFLPLGATGQLSSRNPNIQNAPSHGNRFSSPGYKALAAEFRKIIAAESGKVILSADWSSFHALTLAFEAEDPLYMRLVRCDIHSFVAAHMLVEDLPRWYSAIKRMKPLEAEKDKWLAQCKKYEEGLERIKSLNSWLNYSDEELTKQLSWIKKNFSFIRNTQAKNCIAEGELVLTDKGLIPIEKVALDNRVWDGVEWVQHDGVICQGIQEIIEYDGLKATPDHEIYTESGHRIPFGDAASKMERLENTGNGWQAIRASKNTFRRIKKRFKRIPNCLLSMCFLWTNKMDQLRQSFSWKDERLSELFSKNLSKRNRIKIGQEIRCNFRQMFKLPKSQIQRLWRTWNQMFIHSAQFHRIYFGEVASSRLYPSRNRQNKQQWKLRNWKFKIINSFRTNEEYSNKSVYAIQRRENFSKRFQESIWTFANPSIRSGGYDRGANNRICENSQSTKSQKLGGNKLSTKKVRVYDITNAGPRNRFTVSNKLVSNCILGLGFGMGINHFYNTFRYAFKSKAEPEALHKLIRRLFPKVFIDYHERIRDLADQQTYLISRYGYIRRFYDVYDWRLVKQAPKTLKEGQLLTRNKRTGELWLRKDGVDSNSAIAFNAANDAFGKKKEAMRDLWDFRKDKLIIENRLPEISKSYTSNPEWKSYKESLNLVKHCGLINEIHDDLMFEVEEEKVAEFAPIIKEIMESPASMLKNKVAKEGLVCKVELKVGRNWAPFNDDPKKGELNLEGMKTLHL